MSTVRLRSRHARFRWRNVRFENHTAEVSEAVAAEAAKSRFYGQGRDFWCDETRPAKANAESAEKTANAERPEKKTKGAK
ncbi:MAG: hypothetical protein BroJett004_08050 [Planctomycetota bacterium]|nr:MAG: hypothetical protein BroJett004_08050 [Planctomycetota bacterium]